MNISDVLDFQKTDMTNLSEQQGRISLVIFKDAKLDQSARMLNRLTRGSLERIVSDESFKKRKSGDIVTLAYPAGLQVEALDVVILDRKAPVEELRKAGAGLAKRFVSKEVLIIMGSMRDAAELVQGVALRSYSFQAYKTASYSTEPERITVMHNAFEKLKDEMQDRLAVVEGVFFTRDLVNEPANALTTTSFAERLIELTQLGLKVEVLEEDQLAKLGMGALLCVGQGSESPSKVVVMNWNGGAKHEAPLALVGKGVVFDTGGISLKPAASMPEMIMDMGGAGVVSGTMKALAKRRAKANVVGVVGLVENMPSGSAVRPGDIVTSMKGNTIEVLNTDAEGRLVLCDVMWYTQETFNPCAMIDLATLTGAIIVALGSENAGIFSNDDTFCNALSAAAKAETEGVWRMPLEPGYDKLLKSTAADMANIGGRAAGSIIAAQFLKRFVKDEIPWIHMDIAGVTYAKKEGIYSPPGASGWGVMTLNRLVLEMMEKG